MSEEFQVFVGIDWATDAHQVCVLDADRRVLLERSVKHEAKAIADCIDTLIGAAGGRIEAIAVSIETPRGSVIEAMIERDIAVFAINPKQLDRFRDRHSPAGAKDDRRDAFVLADSLRTDQPSFRRVRLAASQLVELRELTRMHEELIGERVLLGNRLREQIHRYFPQFLQLGSVYDEPWLWALLQRAASPMALQDLSVAKIQSILKAHSIRRITALEVRNILRTELLRLAPGVMDAAQRHVRDLVQRIALVHQQLKECDRDAAALLDQLEQAGEDEPGKNEHRDAGILRSLPGLGTLGCATLLTEAWRPLADRDYSTLRAQCGVAPVTRQSGKKLSVTMRRACNHRLRNTLYHWSMNSVQRDPVTKAHYARLRAKGHSHPRAIRGVGDRLLALLVSMLRSGTPYDAARAASKAA
ncbi:MAG: IS110 family transposase [Polyangiales bacterium]